MTCVLPTGWEEKTLGEVCEIERGGSPRPIKNYITTAPDGLNWIKIGDTDPNGKYIYHVKEKIRPEGLSKSRWVEEDDFLLSNSMSYGRPYILKTNGCIHDGWLVLRKYQAHLQKDFLYYLLSSPYVQAQFKESAQGSTVSNLNTQRVAKVHIPIPPLPEQKRIVEKLDKIFANIDKAKEQTTQNLKNAQEVFESSLDAVLTKEAAKWPEKKLNDVCVVERGSSPRPIKSFITTAPDGVNWIKIGDCSGKYVTSTSQKITPEGAKKSRYVRRGDFIISNSMSYGKPYIMDIDGYIHDGWFVLRLNHSILVADFLYYILSSPFAKRQYDILAAGAIVQNISSDLIKKVKFNLPSISEQKRIVAQLDNLHNKTQELEKVYTQKLVDLDELKQSVLQQAFSGKL